MWWPTVEGSTPAAATSTGRRGNATATSRVGAGVRVSLLPASRRTLCAVQQAMFAAARKAHGSLLSPARAHRKHARFPNEIKGPKIQPFGVGPVLCPPCARGCGLRSQPSPPPMKGVALRDPLAAAWWSWARARQGCPLCGLPHARDTPDVLGLHHGSGAVLGGVGAGCWLVTITPSDSEFVADFGHVVVMRVRRLGYLAITPPRPFPILQQRLHRLALVGVRAPQAVPEHRQGSAGAWPGQCQPPPDSSMRICRLPRPSAGGGPKTTRAPRVGTRQSRDPDAQGGGAHTGRIFALSGLAWSDLKSDRDPGLRLVHHAGGYRIPVVPLCCPGAWETRGVAWRCGR